MTTITKNKQRSAAEITARGFLEKIVIDVGIGRLSSQPNFNDKILPQVIKEVEMFSGQKPQARPAKKSIAGFKVREGQTVGLKVTLRKKRMVDFFERLTKIVLPRVRDFSGISAKSLDGGGVLSIGIKEQSVFPEINQDQLSTSFSLGISMVPKMRDRKKAFEAFRELGIPFEKK